MRNRAIANSISTPASVSALSSEPKAAGQRTFDELVDVLADSLFEVILDLNAAVRRSEEKPSFDRAPHPARPDPRRVSFSRSAIAIIAATCLSDMGHEMVTAILPMYLGTIGLGAAALGVIEGLADLLYRWARTVVSQAEV